MWDHSASISHLVLAVTRRDHSPHNFRNANLVITTVTFNTAIVCSHPSPSHRVLPLSIHPLWSEGYFVERFVQSSHCPTLNADDTRQLNGACANDWRQVRGWRSPTQSSQLSCPVFPSSTTLVRSVFIIPVAADELWGWGRATGSVVCRLGRRPFVEHALCSVSLPRQEEGLHTCDQVATAADEWCSIVLLLCWRLRDSKVFKLLVLDTLTRPCYLAKFAYLACVFLVPSKAKISWSKHQCRNTCCVMCVQKDNKPNVFRVSITMEFCESTSFFNE